MGRIGRSRRLWIALALVAGLRAVPAGAWGLTAFTTPTYDQTNYFRPDSIRLDGVSVDYAEQFSAYSRITNVCIKADGVPLGTAVVQPTPDGWADWSFTWTNPPPPPAHVRLLAVAFADSGHATTGSVGIAICATNDVPVASDISAPAIEATPAVLFPAFQHCDGGQTTILTVVEQPSDGTITIEEHDPQILLEPAVGIPEPPKQKAFVYTSRRGFAGTDTFAYRVSDGADESNVATGTVQVSLNSPPVAYNLSRLVIAGSASNLTIYPSYSDPDLGVQTVTVQLVSDAIHGRVVITNTCYDGYIDSRFLYTVPSGFVGRDFFRYRVNDGVADSNVATGIVDIAANTPPVAYAMRGCTAPTTTVTLTAAYTDADSTTVYQTMTARATRPPQHGVISATNGVSFRYTPAPGFTSGIDSFRFVIHDGVDDSAEAECRVQVRPRRDRAGNTVLIVAASNLYAQIPAKIDRLASDLAAEGYTSRVRVWPSSGTSVSNLWAYLKSQYDATNQWLTGAILLGNLPKARVTFSGASHYTDQVYWNMLAFVADRYPSRRDIWVSRMISEGTTYGDQATLIGRALDANHAYRTGASRLPFTAFYYINPEWWVSYSNQVGRLRDVWPALESRGASASALRFAPARPDLAGYAGADALTRGGELFDETSHGNADGYMANGGWFASADLFRTIAQQRVLLITSCTSGAYGGIVNQSIMTRGGGCVLAVGGSEINYVGDFTLVGSGRAPFRALLAAGESWGGAMLSSYPFSGAERTLMFGDLSMRVMASGASNAMPCLRACTWTERAGRSVTFNVDAEDPDGVIRNIEWFCEGYDAGRRAPTGSGLQTTITHTYPTPGTRTMRVEITDDAGARTWSEFAFTVQGPPDRPMILLSAYSEVVHLYLNGQALSLGPNAAEWTRADTSFAARVNCLALEALNDLTPSTAAGVIAKVLFPDGHAEITDGSWKVFAGTDDPPPDDAQGRPWYATNYDDRAWAAAADVGALGSMPWGRPAGLSPLDGAHWIWAGNPLRGVSPVYLRRSFVAWDAVDSDNDGMSDAQESIAGTDRSNRTSRLTLVEELPPGSDSPHGLSFQTASGRAYTVWTRTNLVTGAWSALPHYSNIWAAGAAPVSLSVTSSQPNAFYRLGVRR